MSDFDDDDFSLGEDDSEEERLDEIEEDEKDFAFSSEKSDNDELAPKPKKARVSPKKSIKTPLPENHSINSPANISVIQNMAPSKRIIVKTKSPASSTKHSPTPTILKSEDAEAAVLDYMRKTNRPYSLLNVFENMHRSIAKQSLMKLLNNLVVKDELVSKTYGKAKIYYMNQNHQPVPSEADRHTVEEQIKTITAECATSEQELKTAEAMLSSITLQVSNEELNAALQQLEETAATLTKKVELLDQPGRVAVSPNLKDSLKRQFTKYHTAWVARKRTTMDGINQIADGMEKKSKVVLELVGIETDEEVGIQTLPAL